MTTLKELRETTGLPQSKFAKLMGLPVRTYEDIERGITKTRPIHIRAAERAVEVHSESRLPTGSESGQLTELRDELFCCFRDMTDDGEISSETKNSSMVVRFKRGGFETAIEIQVK